MKIMNRPKSDRQRTLCCCGANVKHTVTTVLIFKILPVHGVLVLVSMRSSTHIVPICLITHHWRPVEISKISIMLLTWPTMSWALTSKFLSNMFGLLDVVFNLNWILDCWTPKMWTHNGQTRNLFLPTLRLTTTHLREWRTNRRVESVLLM